MASVKVIRRVLVYYTGGTIGLIDEGDGYLRQGTMDDVRKFLIDHIKMHEDPVIRDDFIQLHHKAVDDYCMEEWGEERGSYSILFKMETTEEPIDSTEMTPDHWFQIAQHLQERSEYNGFVVLHGTNTMAYTSSALSFILMDLKKPLILTGAQRSLFHPRSNAMDNLIGALVMAGCLSGPEEEKEIFQQVMLFDNNKLFQGNRVSKFDCETFHVFDCPNVQPLAYMDPILRVAAHRPVCAGGVIEARSGPGQTPDVRILHFFPGIQEKYVRGVLEGAEGVILVSYGAGDVPGHGWLRAALSEASSRKMLMLNCTQVYRGSTRPTNQSCPILRDAGVISGYDITLEAALAKMIWTLKVIQDHHDRIEVMSCSICGESRGPAKKVPTFEISSSIPTSTSWAQSSTLEVKYPVPAAQPWQTVLDLSRQDPG